MKRALFVSSLLLAACGGEQGAPPPIPPPAGLPTIVDPGSGPADCTADDGLELQYIATWDFCTLPECASGGQCPGATEENNFCGNSADCVEPSSYCGGTERGDANFNFNHDGTGPSEPIANMAAPVKAIPGGRCGSSWAVHVRGGPFKAYGGGLWHRLYSDDAQPYTGTDASAWDGISFWARAVPESAKALRLDVGDKNTDYGRNLPANFPTYGLEPNPDGCLPDAPEDGPNIGCDTFGAFAMLDHNWRLFTIDFIEMRQGGWGLAQDRFATEDLWSMAFNISQGSYFDVWIDDVAFFRRKR